MAGVTVGVFSLRQTVASTAPAAAPSLLATTTDGAVGAASAAVGHLAHPVTRPTAAAAPAAVPPTKQARGGK